MAESAKFYFILQVKYGQNWMPAFAFTSGDYENAGWASNKVASISGIQTLVDRICGSRELNIAIPRFYLPYLAPGTELEKIHIMFSDKFGDTQFGMFANKTIIFEEVSTVKVKPILRWKGLPAPPQIVKNHFEKIIGTELYAPVAVTMFVKNAMGEMV